MGPIESELRGIRQGLVGGLAPGEWPRLSRQCIELLFDCSCFAGSTAPGLLAKTEEMPDILSEAIEAAEALGL